MGEEKFLNCLKRSENSGRTVKWHTEADVVTNNNSKATFKGFYGEYDAEIMVNGKVVKKTINLTKKGKNEFILEV